MTNINKYSNSISAVRTPAIHEESPLNGTLLSVFDRLIKDRIIYVTGAVTQDMSDIVSAQILFLDSVEGDNGDNTIKLMIDSPGGSVRAGLSIIDAINLAKSPIHTTCYGMAASMGSVILSAGEKGNREISKYSEVMLHQSSGGTQGNIQDADVSAIHWKKYNENLFDILATNCNKTMDEMLKETNRDFWMNSLHALEYGIVDRVIWDKDTIITLDNIDTVKDSLLYKQITKQYTL